MSQVPETLDDFQLAPDSTAYPADMYPSRLQEIYDATFIQLDERHLQSFTVHIRQADQLLAIITKAFLDVLLDIVCRC